MSERELQLKIAVGKFIELAYEKNKGLTGAILVKKGPAKLTVNSDGTAVLSNSVGVVTFSGSPALKQLGANLKFIDVAFENRDGLNAKYFASAKVGMVSFTASGTFNIEKLITSCSGLLCNAARALKKQESERDRVLKEVMGG